MPRFMVWQPEAAQTEGDGRVIVADSAREAAELWADADDWRSCEFHIVKGTPASVMVRGQDGVAREFIVSGEQVRVYTAKLKCAAPPRTGGGE